MEQSGPEWIEDEEIIDWLEERDWTLIPEHKYENIGEHQYIAQDWYDGKDAMMFRRVVNLINSSPVVEEYRGDEFHYLYAVDFKYWVSESHYSPGVMLNRSNVDPDHIQATLDDIEA